MQEMLSIRPQTSLVTGLVLILLTIMLVTAPIFADVHNVWVHISKGMYDLAVKVKATIACGQQTQHGLLTVSLAMSRPFPSSEGGPGPPG
jgi:hypothetical protein